MPSDGLMKVANSLHQGLLKISGGRMGWTAGKMPVLKLTTTGRKSGEARTVMLTTPHQIGDTVVIVASKGGEPTHPAWFLNLRDNPNVLVETQGQPQQPRTARVATADERAELWPQITGKFSNYAGYQSKTDREIPLVLLEP